MLYLLAILAPPIAVLLIGRPISALLNFGLTLLLWVPGAICSTSSWSSTSTRPTNAPTASPTRSPTVKAHN